MNYKQNWEYNWLLNETVNNSFRFKTIIDSSLSQFIFFWVSTTSEKDSFNSVSKQLRENFPILLSQVQVRGWEKNGN